MKWSLLELNKYKEEPLVFSETLHLKEELLQRDDTLLDVSPIKVEGLLAVNKSEYLLHYTIQVTVTVPSSRSLEPVALPMQITVDEVFMTKEQMDTRDERFAAEEIILLDKPTIDLDESVEDNILLSIPIQVLTEEEQNSQEMPSGNDWEVISEEAYLKVSRKQQNKQWILVWLNYQNYSAIMLKRKITARLEYIVYVNTRIFTRRWNNNGSTS